MSLEVEKSEDCVKRSSVIEVLNKMDRYVADELTLCDTERKFPKNEVFIVDDVYEEIVEQLLSVAPQPKVGEWLRSGEKFVEWGVCSLCKENSYEPFAYAKMHFKYCPQCGCKIQEVEE